MNESPLGKSRLALDIKRSHIQSKRAARNTQEKFFDELSSVLGENFFLVDYESGSSFKFDLLHNANAAIGYGNGLNQSIQLGKKELHNHLNNLDKNNGDDTVLIYSNYPKIMPYVVTKLSCFIENYGLFIDLMENELSIINENLDEYLEFNFDNFSSDGTLELIALGDKYKL